MALTARGINSGSGINVLVDPGATGDMQLTKLAYSAIGSESLVTADALGLLTNQGAQSFRIEVNSAGLTTASTSYTSGDQEGTELTFANAARSSGWGGVISSAVILDKAKILSATPADIDLLIFASSVTGASDNAAFDDSDTDMGEFIARIRFAAGDWMSTASNAVNQQQNQAIGYTCDATSLFGILVGRTNHTFYTAATDLRVALQVIRD